MSDKKFHHDISRREFLKIVGISTASTTVALAGCGRKQAVSSDIQAQGDIPTDKMTCLLYTSPSPRDGLLSRMPSSA